MEISCKLEAETERCFSLIGVKHNDFAYYMILKDKKSSKIKHPEPKIITEGNEAYSPLEACSCLLITASGDKRSLNFVDVCLCFLMCQARI